MTVELQNLPSMDAGLPASCGNDDESEMRYEIMKKILSILLLLGASIASAATPQPMVLHILNVNDFHLDNIQSSMSQGRTYASQQTVCLLTIPTGTTYSVTIVPEGGAGAQYQVNRALNTFPIHFWWGETSDINSFAGMVELTPNEPQIVLNHNGQQGTCASGTMTQLKMTVNGNDISNKAAGHYAQRFIILIKPVLLK